MRKNVSAAQAVFRATILLGVGIAIATSFFAYKDLDAKVPFGSESFFVVTSIADDLTAEDAHAVLTAAATEYSTNLFRVVQATHGENLERTLYVFQGDSDHLNRLYPNERYPSFDRSVTTALMLPDQLTKEGLLGAYSATSDAAALSGLVQHLRDSGISISLEHVSMSQFVLETASRSTFAPVIWGTLIGIGIGALYAVSDRQRILSIKHLHGIPPLRSAVSELVETTTVFVISCLVFSPFFTLTAFVYNNFDQFGRYAGHTLVVLALLLLALLVIQGLGLIFLAEEAEFEVINGKKPSLFLSASINTALLGLLLIAIITATHAAGYEAILRDNEQALSNWDKSSSYVGIEIQAQSEPKLEMLFEGFGEFVADLESRGNFVLAFHPAPDMPKAERPGPDQGNSLIVNPTFLQGNRPELLPGVQDYESALTSSDIVVLLPEQFADERVEIEGNYRSWAMSQRALWPAPVPSSPLEITTLVTSSGQLMFNYDHTGADVAMRQLDPVIAVISSSSQILPAHFYVAAASEGDLLVEDRHTLVEAISDSGLVGQIRPTAPAGEVARMAVSEQQSGVMQRRPAIAFLAILLVLTGLLAGSIHSDRHKAEIFVRRVHGAPLFRRNLGYLVRSWISSIAMVAAASALLGLNVANSVAIGAIGIGLCAIGNMLGIAISETKSRFDFLHRS
ncbi:hypothetical protein CLV85_2514 [Salinibacterium amurskyense]|uniref:FtsX-like permease family protein n=1 Tax=Salinibacterium amurskyense TaxID=205941 RepID=A0A2M9D1L0_9MICO|nr:hypothetical protein [Salinibacterium amurskyense]PJJ78059.1 hypothetical protein CLV85_2514 [Salinibacterium amurskyense]RLQ80214.1 hypothetical protein D9C83_12505 [Salinibacterium amurskyense]GHD82435.1 hypothetical protein GCM10007394_18730 [Salinibacterium amurskyense]